MTVQTTNPVQSGHLGLSRTVRKTWAWIYRRGLQLTDPDLPASDRARLDIGLGEDPVTPSDIRDRLMGTTSLR